MPVLALTLVAVTPASDRHSLGIGLDVLPEAYAVAAARVHAPTDLRLQSCTASGCLWQLGEGVVVAATVARGGIGIDRLTAQRPAGADTSGARERYRAACLTIVALIEPAAPPSRRHEAAAAITHAGSGLTLERPDLGVTFIAARPTNSGEQCGVAIGPDAPALEEP